jgi:hypothetical protein
MSGNDACGGIDVLELVMSGPTALPTRGCLRYLTRGWTLSHADTGRRAELPHMLCSSAWTSGSSSWLGVFMLSLGR